MIPLYDTSLSIEHELFNEQFSSKNVRVIVKRDDLIDIEVSGNKWRKLKLNVALAKQQVREGIFTFGGAYSNHLLATASACARAGMESIGIVRGNELNPESNSLLKRCKELGMNLEFLSRKEYSSCSEKSIIETWKERFPNFLHVPEGGANFHGVVGCQEIMSELSFVPNHVFVAQGTATTSAGLVFGANDKTRIHVVPVLKGFDSLSEMYKVLYPVLLDDELISEYLEKVSVHNEFHFGGYAQKTTELTDFIHTMKLDFDLPLDFVYTAKAFYAMIKFIQNSKNLDGQTILFVHTGGLWNQFPTY
jgi:1-aminocyclopropane-1-carboxylate deaminase